MRLRRGFDGRLLCADGASRSQGGHRCAPRQRGAGVRVSPRRRLLACSPAERAGLATLRWWWSVRRSALTSRRRSISYTCSFAAHSEARAALQRRALRVWPAHPRRKRRLAAKLRVVAAEHHGDDSHGGAWVRMLAAVSPGMRSPRHVHREWLCLRKEMRDIPLVRHVHACSLARPSVLSRAPPRAAAWADKRHGLLLRLGGACKLSRPSQPPGATCWPEALRRGASSLRLETRLVCRALFAKWRARVGSYDVRTCRATLSRPS